MIRRLSLALHVGFVIALASHARADQGQYTNAGGVMAQTPAISLSSPVTTPAGSLAFSCPATGAGTCAGGTFKLQSADGTSTLSAVFTGGTLTQSCSGGGIGGNVKCSEDFEGVLSGTLTLNGLTQTILALTSQISAADGTGVKGATTYVSSYTPFFYGDGQHIYHADDMQGTNQVSYGSQGSGVGQFSGASAIALDHSGRIYVADSYNCRIVRIDDMKGTNWTGFGGSCGSAAGEFLNPAGVALDSTGKIYVMDSGNSRIVRIDDMTGANFTSYGSPGNGVGQFSSFLTTLAVDQSGRIYVPDTANKRLVRINDMTGSNWTTLTQSVVQNSVYYSLQSPTAVSFDSAGRLYIADDESPKPAVVRVDDMTGANWTSISTTSLGLNSISVDSSGTVFTGGSGAHLFVDMSWVLSSSGTIGPLGPATVTGVAVTPLPVARPPALTLSPSSLIFADQTTGTTSAAQPVLITNIGGTVLQFANIAASTGFTDTTDCSATLAPAASCSVSVFFAASVVGPAAGSLTLMDDSSNLGSTQTVPLTGTAIAPPPVTPPPPPVTPTAISLHVPSSPQVTGASITLTANVSATSGIPTGSVSFLDGSTSLGTANLDATGAAIYTITSLAIGTHSLSASYAGSQSFRSSVSAGDTLTVTGLPDYSVGVNPSSLTITAGSTGATTLTINPLNGYNKTITFTCGTLPQYATCSFPAGMLSFSANAPTSQSTLLTINTKSTAVASSVSTTSRSTLGMTLASALPLVLWPLLLLRRRLPSGTRLLPGLLCILALSAACWTLSGCSGASTPTPAPAAQPASTMTTPAGAYTVPLKISDGTIDHSLNLTLTVQ